MARKPRDHKAEWARRKQIARDAGFESVRKYSRVRKQLALPRTAKLSRVGIRQENKDWSDAHSRVSNSRWNPDWDDKRALEYNDAYVQHWGGDSKAERLRNRKAKARALHTYLLGNDLITEDEWEQNYTGLAALLT